MAKLEKMTSSIPFIPYAFFTRFPGDTYWSIDNSFVVDISISELLCQYYEYPLHSDIFSFSLKAPRKKKREEKVILSACSKMFLYLQNIFFEASVKK